MITKADFFLIGYHSRTSVKLSFNSIEIRLSPLNQEIKNYSDGFDLTETACLSLSGIAEKSFFLEIAQSIINLLSLALGEHIIFNRQLYTINNVKEEVFKEMSPSQNAGIQIIPNTRIKKYLYQTLPKYNSLTENDKKAFFIAENYLNQTKHGFIEDRILHTAIAWELMADHFAIKSELPSHLIELRKTIKKSYNNWRRENKSEDPNGQIGSRLFATIDREKFIDKLTNLTKKLNLDYQKLQINFTELKVLRDSVAHSGRIEISGEKAYPILASAILGLQIIMLNWLGYSSLICSSSKDWKIFPTISDFYYKKN